MIMSQLTLYVISGKGEATQSDRGAVVVELPSAAALVDKVLRDVERQALRARNGVRLAVSKPPPVGLTPRDVVWRDGRAQLSRYRSDHRTISPPVLIVYSLISRSYIFDLEPGNSFVEALLAEGLDVYMLDWSTPDERDADNTLEDYVDHYVPTALRRAADLSGSTQVNVIGYCLGGVLGTLYAARDHDQLLRSFVALAVPVDFSLQGAFSTMLGEGLVDVDALLDETGNIPASVMGRSFRVMKPTADVTRYVNLFDRMWNDEWVRAYQTMNYWNGDHVPFPGATARQCAEMLIHQNGMLHGTVVLGGEQVHLSDITCPTAVVVAEKDHIVPAVCALPLFELLGSEDKEVMRLPAGHVGLFVGKTAAKTSIPRLIEYLHRHSDDDTRTSSAARGA